MPPKTPAAPKAPAPAPEPPKPARTFDSPALAALETAPVHTKIRWAEQGVALFASPDGAGQVKAEDPILRLFPVGAELRRTASGFSGYLPEGAARDLREHTFTAESADALAVAMSRCITG